MSNYQLEGINNYEANGRLASFHPYHYYRNINIAIPKERFPSFLLNSQFFQNKQRFVSARRKRLLCANAFLCSSLGENIRPS